MDRRGFIRISSVAALPILLGLFPRNKKSDSKYSISIQSNRAFGHMLREKQQRAPESQRQTDYLIVGGGIAGMAAATALKNENFLLFEGSDRLGGSSAAGSWKSTYFAMGAHYDLAYPKNFGQDVIQLLTDLDIVNFNAQSQLYEFVDKAYLIPEKNAEQCFTADGIVSDVLAEAPGVDAFYDLLEAYSGKMPLPTRLIEKDLHFLNTISFAAFLGSKIPMNDDLSRRISYQMLDDWGGDIRDVSALAGIHYYTCRPYDSQQVQLFSPPQGNAYFIEKMMGALPNPEAVNTNTFVSKIRENEDGIEADILHKNGTVERVKAKGLIYAGQKHALKYVLEGSSYSAPTEYAPWVVLNIVCRKGVQFDKWQNDVLTDDLSFLGFVNSAKQKTRSETHDVFTVYYCFKPEDRQKLVVIEEQPEDFIAATLELITKTTETDLQEYVEHVNLNLMGHAMPIPQPNYLTLQSVPALSERIVLAGVDTGRLPLFFEACDSGLEAAQYLMQSIAQNS